MSDNYLANTRAQSLKDSSTISEAELHQGDGGIKDVWQAIQDTKRKIATRKQEASKAVDDELGPELKALEADYALLLTMSR